MVNNRAVRHIAPAKQVSSQNKLTVIIPDAGAGRRMKSRGPKALLPINYGMTILETQLRTIWKIYPDADIIVVTGFQEHKIRNAFRGLFPVRFVYNPQYESTNVTYSIALGLGASIKSNVLIVYGDLVFNTATIAEITEGNKSKLVVNEHAKVSSENVGMAINDDIVTNLSYGLDTKWSQIAYLTGKELRQFERIAFNYEFSQNWFLHEALNVVIDESGTFVVHQSPAARIIEVDDMEDLDKARLII